LQSNDKINKILTLFLQKGKIAMIIGYIRVSTDKQDLEKQKHTILEYAQKNKILIDRFIEIEVSSRKNQKDRKIDELLSILSKGDELITVELSRLGRNMLEVLNIVEQLHKKGYQLLLFVNQNFQLQIKIHNQNCYSQSIVILLKLKESLSLKGQKLLLTHSKQRVSS